MFVRIKRSVQNGRTYEYLQVVRSQRVGKKVRQKVVANLGRRDRLLASGRLEGLIGSLAKFSEKLRVVEAERSGGLRARRAPAWGPALVFGRLWERQGLPDILRSLAAGRRFGFDVERAAFALTLQRLCAPGSDVSGSEWVKTVEAPGFDSLRLQHFYRTVGFLAEVRAELERELFLRERDLFSQELDLVFVDTTSLYVYRATETALRRRGYSRDRRPELPQMVLCVAVDGRGRPVAWEVLPGNTADVRALEAVVGVLRERFRIGRAVVVADSGMVSQRTIEYLSGHREAPFDYIFGCRLRREREVRDEVVGDGGRFERLEGGLEVKEVVVGRRRYVVCRNPAEAERDRAAREAIVAQLQERLARGPKSLVGNRGYRRYLKVGGEAVSLDEAAVEAEARLDGLFVLRTGTELPAADVARAYKSLWRVERTFREVKSTLSVRPIYHQSDEHCVGHIVAAFLALRLEVDLQRRLEERGVEVSWPALMRDLSQVQAVYVELDGGRYRLRTDLAGSSHLAFSAAGVRPPSPVTASE
jgi:hypothetical protein